MAIYDFECPKCGKREEIVCSIKEYGALIINPPKCFSCSIFMIRIIVTPVPFMMDKL